MNIPYRVRESTETILCLDDTLQPIPMAIWLVEYLAGGLYQADWQEGMAYWTADYKEWVAEEGELP